jgi:hypothetical protein
MVLPYKDLASYDAWVEDIYKVHAVSTDVIYDASYYKDNRYIIGK